jgi:hypothetical protein
LDKLESKCLETREELAIMTVSFTKSSIAAGYEKADNFEANLNSLKTILSMTEGFTDSRGRPSRGNCIPIISDMIRENKQTQQEDQQYEAEQKEAEEARKRQLEREQRN